MRSSLPLALSAVLLPSASYSQQAPPPAPRRSHAVSAKLSASVPAQLPVTHVSLYKNGVGFFEHTGHLTGDQAVTLDLTSAQLDDVLQTLTAVDLGGGHITGANYNSTTPLAQQLNALPFSLGSRGQEDVQPTEQDLYNSLRGARAAVSGSGPTFTGRILALEVRTPPAAADPARYTPPASEQRVLTLIADSGTIRTLALTPATTVRLLDTSLRLDLNTYLELLDRNRTEGIRHLTLTDRAPAGSGSPRELRVSFLSEVPVWKSTYRLLLTNRIEFTGANPPTRDQVATLQGFSVIDNTTGEDWNAVQLSLIAGSPQSFLQPLARPIYNRRPEIPIAEDAQLTPQTHDSALPNDIKMLKEDGAPPPAVAGVAGMAGGAAGGVLGGIGSGSGAGIGAGSGGNLGGGARSIGGGPVNGRQFARVAQPSETVAVATPAPPIAYETVAVASNDPNATTAAFDDFFAYNLTDPVTIPRNGSALVPILQTQLPVESVTLWSPAAPTPLRALWITNSSKLTLDRGSFSVVENGAFAGEGLMDPIHPGERRLLSYAADQAVRVTVDYSHDTRRVTSLCVSKGVLRAANTEIAEVEYLVSNAAPEPRLVLLEEPRRPGWTLDSETSGLTSDPKPAETTPSAYRFRVATAPNQTVRLHIGQRHTLDQYFRLADSSEEQLTFYLRNNSASPALLAQLEPVFTAKRALAALDSQIQDKETNLNQLLEDQKRLRDNLAALKGSTEERTLVKRYTGELNAEEDTLATLRRDLAALQAQRTTAQADLSNRIDALQINSTP